MAATPENKFPSGRNAALRSLIADPREDGGAMKPGSYGYVPIERVHWDKPAAEAVTSERTRFGARRVFTVASRTLARKTDVIAQIRAALGSHDVGLFDECREHTPLESVIACAEAARAAEPDLILT